MRAINKDALYEGRKMKITYQPKADAHNLVIGDNLIVLERGVLEELSRTPIEGLTAKLNAINPLSEDIFKKENITYEAIGFAIAQARIIELEEELRDARGKSYGGWDHE